MTNQKTVFQARERQVIGKKLGTLRKQNLLPGNIFGMGADSQAIELDRKPIQLHIEQEGDSGLIYLKVEGQTKEVPALISEVQQHPITGDLIHIALQRVNLKEKIQTEIPVELEGVFEIKDATVLLVRDTIEVEALPTDLPERFVVNVEKFTEVGQEVRIADLEFDRDLVTIMLSEEELAEPIALVQAVKEEVEEEPAEAVEGAEGAEGAETTGEAADSDGEQTEAAE